MKKNFAMWAMALTLCASIGYSSGIDLKSFSSAAGWTTNGTTTTTKQNILSTDVDGQLWLAHNAGSGSTGFFSSISGSVETWSQNGAALFDVTGGGLGFRAGDGLSCGAGASQTKIQNCASPTVTSAGTTPSIASGNGTSSFRVNVGTGGTATTVVLAMPANSTGWNCMGSNLTATAANRNPTGVLLQQSSTTSAVTMQYQTVGTGVALAFTAADVIQISCWGF